MGRKKKWTERIQLPLADGTTAQIDSLLGVGEVRLDFIRTAINREIELRLQALDRTEATRERDVKD